MGGRQWDLYRREREDKGEGGRDRERQYLHAGRQTCRQAGTHMVPRQSERGERAQQCVCVVPGSVGVRGGHPRTRMHAPAARPRARADCPKSGLVTV